MQPLIFGYKPDPRTGVDEQGNPVDLIALDHDVQNFLAKAPQVATGDVDLRGYCTASNQRSLSSCAGCATTDAVEIETAIETGEPAPELSSLFVYGLARTLNNALDQDEGTPIRSCFQVLSDFGICLESDWPYEESKVFVSPSLISQRKATAHKIRGYYRIKTEGDDRIPDVVATLRTHHPVVFGTLINDPFRSNTGSEIIDRPSGTTIGGHAMIVVGYVGGLFIIKNSWGKNWRNNGFCLMTPAYLTWGETTDIWVPTRRFL